MSQNNVASAKPGETKNDEQKAAAPTSSANNKSNKFLQLDTQKLKLVSDTVKVSTLEEILVGLSLLKMTFLHPFLAKSQK